MAPAKNDTAKRHVCAQKILLFSFLFFFKSLLVWAFEDAPVEAEMQGELREDEVLRQQAVGRRRLQGLLRRHRDQTGFLIQT